MTSRGFDAEIGGELRPGWQIAAGYTFARTKDKSTGGPSSSITPKHLLKLPTAYALPGSQGAWKIGDSAHLQSRHPVEGTLYDAGGNEAGRYHFAQGAHAVWNAMVQYRIDPRWTLQLNVDNVFDRVHYQAVGYATGGNFHGTPRNAVRALRATFRAPAARRPLSCPLRGHCGGPTMAAFASAGACRMNAATPQTLTIDFVSDVSCPWCAIGLHALEQAAGRLQGEVALDLRFQPFELNPQMGPAGQDIGEHLMEKYGATPEQSEQTRAAITQRGAELGFTFNMGQRSRIYNTFDAHRLLHWAGEEGAPGSQAALKHALFRAYFTEGLNPGDHAVLLHLAGEVGLDVERARAVLASDEFADAVREREAFFQQHGIHSVPAVIVNQRHLIQGGQPVEVFEQALRQIAAQG